MGGWGERKNLFRWFHLDQNVGVGLLTVCARVLVWLTSIPYHAVHIYNVDFAGKVGGLLVCCFLPDGSLTSRFVRPQ